MNTLTRQWIAIGLVGAWGLLLAVPTSAVADTPTCFGRSVTMKAEPGEDIVGTLGPDVIWGTTGDDVIRALGGDDRICGRGGSDLIIAGPGDDRVNAGAGRDLVKGGDGNDRLNGQAGSDDLRGGPNGGCCGSGLTNDEL